MLAGMRKRGMFAVLRVMMVSQVYTFVTLKSVHFKYVWFIVYQLYLNKAILFKKQKEIIKARKKV